MCAPLHLWRGQRPQIEARGPQRVRDFVGQRPTTVELIIISNLLENIGDSRVIASTSQSPFFDDVTKTILLRFWRTLEVPEWGLRLVLLDS